MTIGRVEQEDKWNIEIILKEYETYYKEMNYLDNGIWVNGLAIFLQDGAFTTFYN